jgi:hypothetical protein
MADRTLKLVTKTIQNLANLVEFKTKESFMLFLNTFIKEYMPHMRLFIDKISVCWQSPSLPSPPLPSPLSPPLPPLIDNCIC